MIPMAKMTVTAMRAPKNIEGVLPDEEPGLSLVHKNDKRPTQINIKDLE